MTPAAVSYTERYCAFIDILGFGSLISESDRGKVQVAEIYRALSAVHAPPNAVRPQNADLRYQSISDAVALSAAPNAAGFDAICTAAEELSRRLLRSGYFARGGITKGNLYHDHNMVFGPALVEAYRLENEVAKYPRILVPRTVAVDGTNYSAEGTHWKNYFDGRFIKADDGPYFLHVMRNQSLHVQNLLATGTSEPAIKNDSTVILLKAARKAIQTRFDEASDNPDHFQKVAWFAHYWNNYGAFDIEGLEAIAARPL